MRRLLILVILIIISSCEQESSVLNREQGAVIISERMGSLPEAGFKRALNVREFQFPDDHSAHPEFATEWWYFTGNLSSVEGADYGYQLTLFRVGLKAGKRAEDSDWRSHQLYMGHLAISDLQQQKHMSAERFARSAAGLAGSEKKPLRIWLGSWSISGQDEELFPVQLKAVSNEIAIDLTLQSGVKPVVLQGDRGLSQKGSAPGNASYYYSFTRLPTYGVIRVGDSTVSVNGNSWFDREWSSSALASDQAGWDWFSLQLEDGRDLMFYRMRDKQGQAQKFSNGVLVETDGSVHSLSMDNVELKELEFWQSDQGTSYPVGWSLKLPQYNINLDINAFFNDQEMQHTVTYWEGAVSVTGSHPGKGYMELSGYATR